jgi:hypothetical protein
MHVSPSEAQSVQQPSLGAHWDLVSMLMTQPSWLCDSHSQVVLFHIGCRDWTWVLGNNLLRNSRSILMVRLAVICTLDCVPMKDSNYVHLP